MEYISKKSCSIWTVCPCFFMASLTLNLTPKSYIIDSILDLEDDEESKF